MATGNGTLTIAPQPQTITFGALAPKTFGDAAFNVSATASSGLTVSFAASGNCSVAGTLVGLTGAGSCTITASQAGNASYLPAPDVPQTFAIAQASSTTAVTFEPGPYTYRGTAFTATAVATGAGGLNQSVTVSYGGDCTNVTVANGCTATATFAGDTNHTGSSDAKSITIAQATPTITFGPAPLPTFPGSDFTVSATANSGGTLTYSVVSGPCTLVDANAGTFSPTGAGTCVAQADAAATTNYVAGSAQQSITITPPRIDLHAITGTATSPALTVWGYNTTDASVTQPGGPTLTVNQGDAVIIALYNHLAEPTALLVQGQNMIPDTTGVAPGAGKLYYFTASNPGTFLYEAGLLPNAQHQAAMGLHGALVVRPATLRQAYNDVATAYNDEAVLVLSEIDPALNGSASPAAFDMRDYAPRYFLINGKVYPDTATIPSAPGNKVLLRYVNAGIQHHSMALLGLRQNFVAKDASLLPTLNHNVVAETLAPGQTGDAIATVPASTADGSRFAVYDGTLMLHNNGADNAFGGMLTFLTVSGTPSTTDTVGPATSNVVVDEFGQLSAIVSDAGRGGSDVTQVEYFVDVVGASGSGTPVDAFTPAETVTVYAFPYLAGNHTIYVHGMDAAGNWGPFQAKFIVSDTTGPTTSALSLTPNPANGLADVALSGTANDTATGGSNIASAEYHIDAGAWLAMTVSPAGAKVAALSATIPAATVLGLTNGLHNVQVRSTDSSGNQGAPVGITLTVNLVVGPVTSNVVAAPNPNNGTMAFNSSVPAVRVTAHLHTSGGATISATEGFIDTVGANGTGIIFLPVDGLFNAIDEDAYVDIPLSTIASLSDGSHAICVHGKNTAGIWGATNCTTQLVIDKTAPTISSATLSPSSTIVFGTASVTLNVTAADAGTGVTGGQYWIDGTATPPATPTAFAGTSVAINTSALATGVHTVYVRVKDGATNWSAVLSATLTAILAVNDAPAAISANTSATQTSDVNATAGVLTNDQPVGLLGRTAGLVSAPTRTDATGNLGTLTLSCPGSLGTAATPAIGLNTVCTNGAYRVTLNGVGANGNARRSSKQGTYQFTYNEIVNGVTSTAAVTITVN